MVPGPSSAWLSERYLSPMAKRPEQPGHPAPPAVLQLQPFLASAIGLVREERGVVFRGVAALTGGGSADSFSMPDSTIPMPECNRR